VPQTDAENQDRVGSNIRAIRDERGWTQEDVAAKAGIHPTALSMVETGTRAPKLDTLIRLAFALDVDAGRFFAGVERPEGPRPRHGADA
jgi:transcriptional regulator with XRE-family HTH domain